MTYYNIFQITIKYQLNFLSGNESLLLVIHITKIYITHVNKKNYLKIAIICNIVPTHNISSKFVLLQQKKFTTNTKDSFD